MVCGMPQSSWHYTSGSTVSLRLADRGRDRHTRRPQRLVGLGHELTAHDEPVTAKNGFHLMQVIESAQDLVPFPALTRRRQAALQFDLKPQRQETTEHMTSDRLVAFVPDWTGFQDGLGRADERFHR